MTKLSCDEAQIYDRQIRLWGMEAQNRLRNSSVLIVGMSGLGAEVAKNLMLSGLKSLTLMDDKQVSASDYSSNFLLVHGDAKTNRAEASFERVKLLNPMVEVSVCTDPPLSKPEQFYAAFDLVVVLDQNFAVTNSINKMCRNEKIRFQAGCVLGWLGYAFFDFNGHQFLVPKPKAAESIVESVIDDDDEEEGENANENKKIGGNDSGSFGGSTEELSAVKKMKINGSESGGAGESHHHVPVHTVTIGDEEDSKMRKIITFPSFEQTFVVELGTKRFLRRKFNFPSSYFVVRAFFSLLRQQSEELTDESLVEQWRKELQAVGSDEKKQKIAAEDFPLLVGPALNSVCAIVGSVIGQEAIKALSQNDVPLRNVFFYSALEGSGMVLDMAAV